MLVTALIMLSELWFGPCLTTMVNHLLEALKYRPRTVSLTCAAFPSRLRFGSAPNGFFRYPMIRIDKPFQTDGKYEVHIVESWESPDHWNETKHNKIRAIHAYSNAPFIELLATVASPKAPNE